MGLGLLLSVAGLLLAELGACVLLRHRRVRGPFLPAGALVVSALPPFWTYATAGLETGLSLPWIGGSFLALTTL